MNRSIWALVLAVGTILSGCESSAPAGSDASTTAAADSVSVADSLTYREYEAGGHLHKPMPAAEDVTSGDIWIAVDESLRPIMEAEIEIFEALYRDANVSAMYLPGEAAIEAMLRSDSVRLAVATRELTSEESQVLLARAITPKYATPFRDAVVLIAHPELGLKGLRTEELSAILAGKISRWTELDNRFPDLPIRLVVPGSGSSLLRSLRETYLPEGRLNETSVFSLEDTEGVYQYVRSHPGTLGLIGFSWISDRDDPDVQRWRDSISIVSLERMSPADSLCNYDQNFFPPFQSYLYLRCYPLTRNVVTILRESGQGLGTGFVAFLDGPQGQRVVHKDGLSARRGIGREIRLPSASDANDPDKQLLIETN